MGFPGQEYWSRLPFPSPGDLPDPGIRITGRRRVIGSCEDTFELNISNNFLGIRTLQNLKCPMLSNNEVSMTESICTKTRRYATKYILSY